MKTSLLFACLLLVLPRLSLAESPDSPWHDLAPNSIKDVSLTITEGGHPRIIFQVSGGRQCTIGYPFILTVEDAAAIVAQFRLAKSVSIIGSGPSPDKMATLTGFYSIGAIKFNY